MPVQLCSLVHPDGWVELSLAECPQPRPQKPDDLVVRMEAAPLNPSDLGLLLAGADVQRAKFSGTPQRPLVKVPLEPAAMAALAGRVGQPLPAGNEGAGTVIAAGQDPAAQALLGRRVAALAGGGTYASYCTVPLAQCLPLPEGASASAGASSFVNPLTALGLVETMRRDGHDSLLHTVGASNLGQMLNRICLQDGIPLINLVRRAEQARLLHSQGATRVLDTSAPDFATQLAEALVATGTRLAFDPIGGGPLAGQLLMAMEAAQQQRSSQPYSRYGSLAHKQVYIYGSLDRGPIVLPPGLGYSWSVSGWLLFPFLQQTAPARVAELKDRVASELSTTFASHYERELGLAELLTPEALAGAVRMATGQKLLLRPGPD